MPAMSRCSSYSSSPCTTGRRDSRTPAESLADEEVYLAGDAWAFAPAPLGKGPAGEIRRHNVPPLALPKRSSHCSTPPTAPPTAISSHLDDSCEAYDEVWPDEHIQADSVDDSGCRHLPAANLMYVAAVARDKMELNAVRRERDWLRRRLHEAGEEIDALQQERDSAQQGHDAALKKLHTFQRQFQGSCHEESRLRRREPSPVEDLELGLHSRIRLLESEQSAMVARSRAVEDLLNQYQVLTPRIQAELAETRQAEDRLQLKVMELRQEVALLRRCAEGARREAADAAERALMAEEQLAAETRFAVKHSARALAIASEESRTHQSQIASLRQALLEARHREEDHVVEIQRAAGAQSRLRLQAAEAKWDRGINVLRAACFHRWRAHERASIRQRRVSMVPRRGATGRAALQGVLRRQQEAVLLVHLVRWRLGMVALVAAGRRLAESSSPLRALERGAKGKDSGAAVAHGHLVLRNSRTGGAQDAPAMPQYLALPSRALQRKGSESTACLAFVPLCGCLYSP